MPDSKDIFKGLPEITIGEMGKSKRRGIKFTESEADKVRQIVMSRKITVEEHVTITFSDKRKNEERVGPEVLKDMLVLPKKEGGIDRKLHLNNFFGPQADYIPPDDSAWDKFIFSLTSCFCKK